MASGISGAQSGQAPSLKRGIERNFDRLEQALDDLASQLGGLESQCSPILVPRQDSPNAAVAASAGVPESDVAGWITSSAIRVERMVEALAGLRSRLDV